MRMPAPPSGVVDVLVWRTGNLVTRSLISLPESIFFVGHLDEQILVATSLVLAVRPIAHGERREGVCGVQSFTPRFRRWLNVRRK